MSTLATADFDRITKLAARDRLLRNQAAQENARLRERLAEFEAKSAKAAEWARKKADQREAKLHRQLALKEANLTYTRDLLEAMRQSRDRVAEERDALKQRADLYDADAEIRVCPHCDKRVLGKHECRQTQAA